MPSVKTSRMSLSWVVWIPKVKGADGLAAGSLGAAQVLELMAAPGASGGGLEARLQVSARLLPG